jgi:FkbM family methyltransferase
MGFGRCGSQGDRCALPVLAGKIGYEDEGPRAPATAAGEDAIVQAQRLTIAGGHVDSNLVFDVGMHTGSDTDFYLQKGFSVVAVEANPTLVRHAKTRFAEALATRRLKLYDVAVSHYEGEVEFFVSDEKSDWGTIYSERATLEHLAYEPVVRRVPCTTFDRILRDNETPYYLKIDIEGADTLCLEALLDWPDRPRYISIEASMVSRDGSFEELNLLSELGYRHFKIVNQALNSRVRCPNPPREGEFVDYRFDGTCSGPFGEEAPGSWLPLEAATRRCLSIEKNRARFGMGGRQRGSIRHRLHRLVTGQPVGWYDIHARWAQDHEPIGHVPLGGSTGCGPPGSAIS